MSWLPEFAISVAGGLAATFITVEASAWSPRAARFLLERAVRRLPRKHRARFEEEWASHAADLPTKASKLLFALGVCFAAGKILRNERQRLQSMRRQRNKGSTPWSSQELRKWLLRALYADPEYKEWATAVREIYAHQRNHLGSEQAEKWLNRQLLNSVPLVGLALAKAIKKLIR